MGQTDASGGRLPESATPTHRPVAPDRPASTGTTGPLEVRTFRRTFSALPGQIHEVEPGDTAGAVALRARWRTEYAFLHLGVEDELDTLLGACDALAAIWAEDPTVGNREWLVDAIVVTQSVLIEQLEGL